MEARERTAISREPDGPAAELDLHAQAGLLASAAGRAAEAVAMFEEARALLVQAVTLLHEAGVGGAAADAAARLGRIARDAPRVARSGPVVIGRLPDADVAVLSHEGDYWTLSYRSGVCRLRDRKGLAYLRVLLEHPGREFHVMDLVRSSGTGPVIGSDERASRGTASRQELLDRPARVALKVRLAELRDELDEAESWSDDGRASRARDEIDAIAHHLSAAVGLGGRSRRARDDAERARVNVTRHVRTAIGAIGEHDEMLGAHLRTAVCTGAFCCYRPGPDGTLRWRL